MGERIWKEVLHPLLHISVVCSIFHLFAATEGVNFLFLSSILVVSSIRKLWPAASLLPSGASVMIAELRRTRFGTWNVQGIMDDLSCGLNMETWKVRSST